MKDPDKLREMSDHELYEWVGGWNQGNEKHIAGMQEIERRNSAPANLRSWIAIGISVVSLVVVILVAIFK